MKKLLWIASALFAAMAVSSCNDIKEDLQSSEPRAINITASVGRYAATKATDTAFEAGDSLGLFVGEPLNINNLLMVSDGSKLVLDSKLFWGENQTTPSVFKAYYPYNAELKDLSGKLPFKVKANQNSAQNYTRSDLMAAGTEAGPDVNEVHLTFDHLLSKLLVKLDNQSGEPVKEVLVAGFRSDAVVDCETMKVSLPEKEEQYSYEYLYPAIVTDAAGAEYFSLIIPPQDEEFAVAVTLLSGRVEIFYSEAEFVQGKQCHGTITIPEQKLGEKVDFEVSVADWDEGGKLIFSDAEVGQRAGWRLYYVPAGGTRELIPMEEKYPGAFFVNLPDYRDGDWFYVLSNNNNYIYGCTLALPQPVNQLNNEWPLVNGGRCQLSGFEGELNVWFYPDEGILKYDPVYPNWTRLGEAEIVRGMFSAYYGFIPEITKARLYEDQNHPGVYMVENPYGEWGVQNEYIEFYRDIIIDARNPEKVYMKPVNDLYEASMLEWARSFSLLSPVAENRFAEAEEYGDDGYGTMQNGVIRLGLLLAQYNDEEQSLELFNTDNAFQLVLPGYTREPVLGFGYSYEGLENNGDVVYANFRLSPYPDMQRVQYMFFAGKPSNEEINGSIIPAFRAGEGEAVPGLEMGHEYYFQIPITQSGRYTGFFYADAPDFAPGYFWYWYNYFAVEVEGSEFPQAQITLSKAEPSTLFPDKAAAVHVDFPYATNIMVRAISVAAAQEAGLTEDDYYSYAMDADYAPGFMGSYGDNTGIDLGITGLEPDTDYLVIAAAADFNGVTACTSATIHTLASPQWEDFGTGEWVDSTQFTMGYRAPVQIQKVPDAERYRAVTPYKEYLTNVWPTLTDEYVLDYYPFYGTAEDSFEFALVPYGGGSYIYYLPFRPGYVYARYYEEGTDTGFIEMNHFNISMLTPNLNSRLFNNREFMDGVYNIAPYASIVGVGRYFNFMDGLYAGWVLVMPGHSYGPVASQAPAKPRNLVELPEVAPVRGEHKVLPFKRLPLKMGKPVVTVVNENNK